MRARLLPTAVVTLAVAAVVAVGTLAMISRPATVPDPPAGTSRPSGRPPSTDRPCASSLQAAIDAAAVNATIDLSGCTFRSGATIDKPLTIVGATVRVPAGQAGISVEADGVTLDGLEIIGPQSTAFVFDEVGVYATGTPTAPIRRLTIRNSEIAAFGGFGTYLRNVSDLRLQRNDVRDIVYAGLMVLSGTGGLIEGNVVRRVGVEGSEGNGGNAYGIVLTTQTASEPPTSGFLVSGNTVEDVPTWHAFDTHGGRDIVFAGNTVRRSMRGIFITTDGAGNRPTNIAIVDNSLLSPAPIEANVAAVTTYQADIVAITGNTVIGWGEGNFLRDFEDLSTRVVVDRNTVEP